MEQKATVAPHAILAGSAVTGSHFRMHQHAWHLKYVLSNLCYSCHSASPFRYVSNTRTKFVFVVEGAAPKDEDMRTVSPMHLPPHFHRRVQPTGCSALLQLTVWLCASDLPLSGYDLALLRVCIVRQVCTSTIYNFLHVQLFRRFHAAFIDVVSNPFYELGEVCFTALLLCACPLVCLVYAFKIFSLPANKKMIGFPVAISLTKRAGPA